MQVFVDKVNLLNLFKADTHPLQRDAERVLKKSVDIYFNFTKEEAFQDDLLALTLASFATGAEDAPTRTFKSADAADKPAFELKTNLHTTWKNKQTAFLVDAPSEKIKLCQEQGGVFVFGPGNEFELFKHLFLLYEQFDTHRGLEIGSDQFRSWDDLKAYVPPFTDVILIDNYISAHKELLTPNLLHLLDCLHYNKKIETNLVVFTDKSQCSISPNELRDQIQQSVKKVTSRKINVTIVLWRQQKGVNSYAEHDRTVVTPYTRWKSGDSFAYFNSQGGVITRGRELDLFTLHKRGNQQLVQNLLATLNKYLEWCRTHNPENITGDRKSNLLTIPAAA